jgi:hypothetical protein
MQTVENDVQSSDSVLKLWINVLSVTIELYKTPYMSQQLPIPFHLYRKGIADLNPCTIGLLAVLHP